MKGGPFALSSRWPDLALVVLVVSVRSGPFSVRSVVWRKKGHCKSRAIFDSQEAPTKKQLPFVPERYIRTVDVTSVVNCVLLKKKRRFKNIALYPKYDVIFEVN